jgi:methylated-DNA-protein-cysteine methyltransferase-like protein
MPGAFFKDVVRIIRKIPRGRVATYGQIAALAGSPRAARQVVRILHSSSETEKLPWHRVVNAKGGISLAPGRGYELQKALLEKEGVAFGIGDRIDFDRFLWTPPPNL